MRSLLFRHDLKSKHIKNIKSKTYRRLSKKDKLKANSLQSQMDPEASKELAKKQEYERAKVIDYSVIGGGYIVLGHQFITSLIYMFFVPQAKRSVLILFPF